MCTKTGIYLNKKEQEKIKKFVKEAGNDSWGMTVNGMFSKGMKTKVLLEKINELAINHGLPNRETYYGLSQEYEVLK